MKQHIEQIENLGKEDAVAKIKELVDDTRICMFTTRLDHLPLQSRPMSTLEVDAEGNLWFFSDDVSNKNLEIEHDSRVQLFYSNPSKTEFMTIFGHAMVSKDRKRIDELWHPMAKAWFTDKDDPALALIMVMPSDAYYWDTKHNKLVSLIKIMSSVASGKTREDGVEGRLDV